MTSQSSFALADDRMNGELFCSVNNGGSGFLIELLHAAVNGSYLTSRAIEKARKKKKCSEHLGLLHG